MDAGPASIPAPLLRRLSHRPPALAPVSVALVRQAFVLAYFRAYPRAGQRLRAPGATHGHGLSVHET
jgi:hypothetical protein